MGELSADSIRNALAGRRFSKEVVEFIRGGGSLWKGSRAIFATLSAAS